eukprot:4756228-Pleurochrysis_carterae.AAC.1
MTYPDRVSLSLSLPPTLHLHLRVAHDSYEGAKSWVKELKILGQPSVVIALAANTSDLDEYVTEGSRLRK